jgi:hypothetical protein
MILVFPGGEGLWLLQLADASTDKARKPPRIRCLLILAFMMISLYY